MSQTLVTTRPERTSDQIAVDRKSANAFFHRLATLSGRDLGRVAAYEAHDYKLLMADQEGREWASRNNLTATQRHTRKAEADAQKPLRHRDNSKLCHYVAKDTRKIMPRQRLHKSTPEERSQNTTNARHWRNRTSNPTPWFRARVLDDGTAHFEHWLLCNPSYGPEQAGEDPFPPKTFNPAQTRKGQISPAGMTPEKALQIALAVFDDHGGHW